jgi:hypothetical protein
VNLALPGDLNILDRVHPRVPRERCFQLRWEFIVQQGDSFGQFGLGAYFGKKLRAFHAIRRRTKNVGEGERETLVVLKMRSQKPAAPDDSSDDQPDSKKRKYNRDDPSSH